MSCKINANFSKYIYIYAFFLNTPFLLRKRGIQIQTDFFHTLTAFLNLMQKSWKMRKHSSSLKVSLSSQKKSMSALPSLRRSILRLFKSWSVCAELCRGRKTHFSFKLRRALSEGDGGLSQQHHTGPGPALPQGRVCLFMLHNCCRIVNLQKGLQLPLQPLVSLNLLLQGFNANVQGGELQLDVLHGDPASRRLRNKEFGDEITLSQLQQYQQHRLHDNILHGGRREGGRKGGASWLSSYTDCTEVTLEN